MANEPNLPSQQKLAVDRSHLANERTLLAYIRTSLSMIGFGVLVLRFDPNPSAPFIGWGLMILAIIIMVIGGSRFFVYKKEINGK